MTTLDRTVQLVRYPLRIRFLTVERVERVTPLLVRVTLTGDDLDGFQTLDADDHIKVFFPRPGESRPAVPQLGPSGIIQIGGQRPIARDYTPRRFDPIAGELDIDFVIHGHGPASAWADQAAPGQVIAIGGPRGSHIVPDNFDWYLICGDETALPSIARRLESLPPGRRAVAVIEVPNAAEEQPITTAAAATIVWVHRDEAGAGGLEAALRAIDLPPGDGFAWVSGEATEMKGVRRYLLQERGFNREWCRFSGHWKRGHANFDHHTPIED